MLVLCSLLVCLGLHIIFSKLDLCLSLSFTFLGLCWDTVHMSVSLPPDKLADFQQLALSLLQTLYVTVCRVMSSLGKAKFYTAGHSHLLHLCCVIQSGILGVYHSPTQLFSCVHFLFPLSFNWNSWLYYSKVLSIAISTSWCGHCYWCYTHPLIGLPYQLVVPGQVPCLGLILPCRNFWLLLSC